MNTLTVIDLNDSNIRVASGDQMLLSSPGYAVIKDNKIAFGTSAAKLTRIYPRSTHDDYWYRLGQEAIQSTSNQIRHNADLAYMQLAEIYEQAGKPTNSLIAVPSSFNQDQLGLLLGLLKAANFQNVKLIDSALLASIKALNQGEQLHLDIQLHQSVLTRIETDKNHQVIATEILPDIGLMGIHEQCARLISHEFINQSRFDPHHNAETEQLLFEKIPDCLARLTDTSISKMDIEYKSQSYSANITRETILKELLPLYERIYKRLEKSKELLLSHRFGNLPGFIEGIDNAYMLDEFALFATAKDYMDYFHKSDPDNNYLSKLPVIKAVGSPKNTSTEKHQSTDITHILINDIAYKLDGRQYFFTVDHQLETKKSPGSQYSVHYQDGHYSVQNENNAQVFLNDNIINSKTVLGLGDRIKTTAEKSSTLIMVK